VLVVGVGGDMNVKKRKSPFRPILSAPMRMKMVDALKPVDHCFLNTHTPVHHSQEYLDAVFEVLRPDVWVVNEDASDIPYRRELAKKHGVELVILERTAPPEFGAVSTTALIRKIQEIPKE
jgi:bifunctional ADP-heptose synthase (sugar kinase/adenylyltransferase)